MENKTTFMHDYAIAFNGHVATPNQTPVDAANVESHNAAIEAQELAQWAERPERMFAYYTFQCHGQMSKWASGPFRPICMDAYVSTWRGVRLGAITSANVYRHNFGSRMVAITVQGTNGATYHGRASWDNGDCIILRRSK